MKTTREPRQRTVSFKITQAIDAALTKLRLRMSNKSGNVVTKTDVIEEAIRTLAKKEKIAL